MDADGCDEKWPENSFSASWFKKAARPPDQEGGLLCVSFLLLVHSPRTTPLSLIMPGTFFDMKGRACNLRLSTMNVVNDVQQSKF